MKTKTKKHSLVVCGYPQVAELNQREAVSPINWMQACVATGLQGKR